MSDLAPRILPRLDDVNRAFWTGGKDGHLLIQRCDSCDRWQHPPEPRCVTCDGEVTPRSVAGTGTLLTFTVNHQQFHPEVPPPYVIALVELDEHNDLRIPANVVGVPGDPEDLEIGQPMRVSFEPNGEIYVPVFAPVLEGGA